MTSELSKSLPACRKIIFWYKVLNNFYKTMNYKPCKIQFIERIFPNPIRVNDLAMFFFTLWNQMKIRTSNKMDATHNMVQDLNFHEAKISFTSRNMKT